MKLKGEKKEVVVRIAYKLAGVKCDVCGHIIEPPPVPYEWMEDEYKYYDVTTGHNDWGNDSCDSVKHHDICPNCINKFVAGYLGNDNAYLSAYIEIETEHVYYNDIVYEED